MSKDHYMTEEHVQEVNRLRDLATAARDAIDLFEQAACSSELLTAEAVQWVLNERLALRVRGLLYFLTPQREWTGGDSADPKNYKFRYPHIFNV